MKEGHYYASVELLSACGVEYIRHTVPRARAERFEFAPAGPKARAKVRRRPPNTQPPIMTPHAVALPAHEARRTGDLFGSGSLRDRDGHLPSLRLGGVGGWCPIARQIT
jgi:hypothetical protein